MTDVYHTKTLIYHAAGSLLENRGVIHFIAVTFRANSLPSI
jgi:hypothetical protein